MVSPSLFPWKKVCFILLLVIGMYSIQAIVHSSHAGSYDSEPVFHVAFHEGQTSDDSNIIFEGEEVHDDEGHRLIDTLLLDEVRILAPRIERPDHQQPVLIQTIEPEEIRYYRQESAAYLIGEKTFAMVRDYGAGNMATVTQRGFSASQTRVMWEDLPLNHPMLGSFDFSMVPAGLLDGIAASSGNPAAMTGAGGLGGTISLNTRQSREQAYISQSIGSFGFQQTGVGASVQNDSFQGSVKAYHKQADYNFEYFDIVRATERTRENNAKRGSYLVAQGRYAHEDWQFRSLLWLDDIVNNLPGPVTSPTPAQQEDRSVRWLAQAGFTGFERMQLRTTAGFYQYELDYTDGRTHNTDQSTSRLFMLKPDMRYTWVAGHESQISAHWALQRVESDNYRNTQQESEVSLRMRHSWDVVNWFSVHPSLETAYHTAFDAAINPALGFTLTPAEMDVTMRGMVSRNRNTPSYNDLYWSPGGNPELVPEQVTTLETGITYNKNSNKAGLTIFHHDFDEGIRWRPGADGRFTPENIEDIRSYGIEAELHGKFRVDPFRFDAHYMVTWTRTTIREERFSGDKSVGKQMIYVPEWQHKSGLRISYKDLYWLRLSVQHTDERYTTFDHSAIRDPLDAFTRLDLDIGSEWSFSSYSMGMTAGIRNLGDSGYEFIQSYPAAPRHYNISITLSLL